MNSNELQAYEADMGKGINFTPWRQAVLEPRLAKKSRQTAANTQTIEIMLSFNEE